MKENQFKKRGLYSTEEATFIAFSFAPEVFYLNHLTDHVHKLMKPFCPYDGTVSRKLRALAKKGKVNYTVNNEGIYHKVTNVN
jgi:hypothetical protein